MLTNQEILRYSRHLIMPNVGRHGQEKLKAAKVLLVGTGGLGSPLALYLTAAGVGTLGLVDFDVVDETNLQRQVLHGTSDVGREKLHSAQDRLHEINPYVKLQLHHTRLTSENALAIIAQYDVVADGTDNFPTRYLVNDACVLLGKPNVYGSIFQFEGQVSVFATRGGPCYRCLFREPPPPGLVPSCAEGGVLGVLPGIVGSLQALEVLKLVLGVGEPLIGRLQLFDGLRFNWRELKVHKHPQCPVCSAQRTIHELIDYEAFCGVAEVPAVPEISARDLKQRIDRGDVVTIIDVRERHEWDIANLSPYGARLIPLSELSNRLPEVNVAGDIVVHCKSGARSARALQQLRAAGLARVWNLQGGILAWAVDVDPSIPQY